MSIFVSIASYRDPLLRATIESARDNARHPDDLHFGIVDQDDAGFVAPAGASYVRIDAKQARGPCFARAIAMSFYRGEDWFLQIDSHMDFDRDWDERLATQAAALSPGRRGVVLTTYPNAFEIVDGVRVHKPVTEKGVLSLVVKKGSHFAPSSWNLSFEGLPVETNAIMPGFHVGAGCLFATGRFALDLPYDPALYFHGEEQTVALRLFTAGWDIFHPPGMPIWHLYTTTGMQVARPLHWDVEEEKARDVRWGELEQRSRQRFAQLVAGVPLGAYGLGSMRNLTHFAQYCGIDYRRRAVGAQAYHPLGMRPPEGVSSMSVGTTNAPRTRWGE